MGLIFNRGCSSHHFKNNVLYCPTNLKIKNDKILYIAEREIECEHEGCKARKIEEEVLESLNIYDLMKFMDQIDDGRSIEDIIFKLDQPEPKQVRQDHCRRLTQQIKEGEYENLDEMKEALEEAADQ